MTQVHHIRKMYFEEGKNITQISQETGRDRKTVRSYLEKEDWNKEKPAVQKDPVFPKLSSFKDDIDQWLEEDKKAKRKQRHTAKRVYDMLTEKYGEEFTCSYRTVAGYVSMRKKEIFGKKCGYLPLEHIPGEAQVDFGDADYYENGRHYSGKYLNLSFPYSNKGYFQLFKGENQECLFEGLVALFEHIGGIPPRIWFDNASTMVVQVLKQGGRQLTEDFKGRPGSVLPLPAAALDVSKYVTMKTNGYGRFYLNNGLHEYSVSPKYANSRVLVKMTANEVIPLDESHREIVRHERFYGDQKQQSMKWLPYLTQLARSPGALKYTGIFQMLPESVQSYLERCNKGDTGKVLQAIATLTEKNGFESAVEL